MFVLFICSQNEGPIEKSLQDTEYAKGLWNLLTIPFKHLKGDQ
jgi:hypothetical protein